MNSATKPRRVVVYGREGCHLCEDMIASLRSLQKKIQFEFEVINVDNDENLIQLYGERVPVLFAVEEQKNCVITFSIQRRLMPILLES